MIEVVGALSKESSLFQNHVDVVFYVYLRHGFCFLSLACIFFKGGSHVVIVGVNSHISTSLYILRKMEYHIILDCSLTIEFPKILEGFCLCWADP